MTTTSPNRDYYDAFSNSYDDRRSVGYHKLVDEQSTALVKKVGEGGDLCEVGCGTGLILQRVQEYAKSACGVDLSPGMLEHARKRGLEVQEANATELPFADESFDVAYSFKVLAHVPDLHGALREMARVVRPGGHLVIDVYNKRSFRYLIKRLWGHRKTSQKFDEGAVSTRFLAAGEVAEYLPANTKIVSRSGIRIVTLLPVFHKIPVFGWCVAKLEWALMNTWLSRYAGFMVFTVRKDA